MLREFLLDGDNLPEVFLSMYFTGSEKGGKQLFDGLQLLILAVVLLDNTLVVAGKPVEGIAAAQFGDALPPPSGVPP